MNYQTEPPRYVTVTIVNPAWLRWTRKRAGWKQKQVQVAAGFVPRSQQISKMENGRLACPPKVLAVYDALWRKGIDG